MLTRSGVATCATAAASFAAGRVFGLPELFVVGAALVAAVVLAVAAVTRRRPVLTVRRTAHPPMVHVGEIARVDLALRHGLANAQAHPPPEVEKNLQRLAECLTLVADKTALVEVLQTFPNIFERELAAAMAVVSARERARRCSMTPRVYGRGVRRPGVPRGPRCRTRSRSRWCRVGRPIRWRSRCGCPACR